MLHTPGRTPDELAWYDQQERHLYVGDSFCERVAKDNSYEQPIIFPKEGIQVNYMQSLKKPLRFVEEKDEEPGKAPTEIDCGHYIHGEEILLIERQIFQVVLAASRVLRGEVRGGIGAQAAAQSRFSVAAPKKLAPKAARAV